MQSSVSSRRPHAFWDLLLDSWTIAKRDIIHWKMQPTGAIIGWLFPVMTMAMFGFFFGGSIKLMNGVSYFEFIVPGVLAMAIFFGLEGTMLAVYQDSTRGVTDRFRSLPIQSAAVVMGRCLADMINASIGLLVLAGAGYLLGWRWHGNVASVLLAFCLLLWFRFSLLWVGIFLGLLIKGADAIGLVQILVWPVSFLSNVFVDPTTMPVWLGVIAEWNPLSLIAMAIRQLFGNEGWATSSWIVNFAIPGAILWPLLITLVFLPLAVRRYRHLQQ